MKILSFDVGIKNLAYCILEVDSEIKYKILEWDIIDLVLNPIYKCCQKNGKKEDCTVDAKFVDSEMNYYCGRHKKRAKKVKAIKFKKASKMSLHELATNLYMAFSKNSKLLQVDKVVIENQPCLQNPKMKSIQMLIYSYFIFNGKCSSSSSITDISLFSASKKLDVYPGEPMECKLSSKYAQRKYLSIQYCGKMIVKQTEYLDFFNNSRKKDDLADCYMQGCYYLNKNKLL